MNISDQQTPVSHEQDPQWFIGGPFDGMVNASGGNPAHGRIDLAPGVTFRNDVLRIEGIDRTVVYRIGLQTQNWYCYLAEWPD